MKSIKLMLKICLIALKIEWISAVHKFKSDKKREALSKLDLSEIEAGIKSLDFEIDE